MKTIVISTEKNGRTTVLEQIMRGALSFGWCITKYTHVFDTKKEAQERLKYHPCGRGLKFITLSQKQIRCLEYFGKQDKRFALNLSKFLELK